MPTATPPGDPSARRSHDLAVHADRALVDGAFRAATIAIDAGRITAVLPPTPGLRAAESMAIESGHVLLPGLVDTHVHVNEPGRTAWEGFASATTAAGHGGVTTIVDMPLNSLPPTLTPDALELKRHAALAAGITVDVGFWGGVTPETVDVVGQVWNAGVFGVKAFMQDSGVPEFPPLDDAQLRRVLSILADRGGLLIVHAEDPAELAAAPAPAGRDFAAFVASRPVSAEIAAIARVIDAARETGGRAHVVHVSSGAGARLIIEAAASGVPISGETCPHYLTLAAETIPDGDAAFKCCPPVRGAIEQDALWEALLEPETHGAFDMVVSDHSPCTPDLKLPETGDLGAAWGGIASLEVGLRAMWTQARRRGVPLEHVVTWMSRGPADFVGLKGKGRIARGADADLVAFDPDSVEVVRAVDLHHRNAVSAYDGAEFHGAVRHVWLAGRRWDPALTQGRLLSRSGASTR